jgi:hypothetical protein
MNEKQTILFGFRMIFIEKLMIFVMYQLKMKEEEMILFALQMILIEIMMILFLFQMILF